MHVLHRIYIHIGIPTLQVVYCLMLNIIVYSQELIRRIHSVQHFGRTGPADAHLTADDLYDLLLAEFHAWILLRHTHLLSPESAEPDVVSQAVVMLETTAVQAAHVSQAGFVQPARILQTVCAEARARIDAVAAGRVKKTADTFTLPASCGAVPQFEDLGVPRPPFPTLNEVAFSPLGHASLGTLPVLGKTASFSELKAWLDASGKGTVAGLALQHCVGTVERVVFHRMGSLFAETVWRLQEERELQALREVFKEYVDKMLDLIRSEDGQMLWKSELHSRLSLVVCALNSIHDNPSILITTVAWWIL
jgi:hypothetical protein